MNDLISRQAAIDVADAVWSVTGDKNVAKVWDQLKDLPSAQPEQLEQCPIYGGMCAYPSDQCYDCPRHAGARMEVTT